ncbi:hypothetical protein LCGC14_1143600 [marine sediment metagenome]|uniref:Uncharacterized protein n=1 Tax=marine sediment metagenome TaxID=412755 RepID=A0A0F9M2E1_9ZZZZ
MSDTFQNSFGVTVKPLTDYGIWTLSAVFNSPENKDVGVDDNRFPFNTLISGTFPDYDITTHKFTVTRKGLYEMEWNGELTGGDVATGTQRQALVQMTTSFLAPIAKEACSMQAVAPGVVACFGARSGRILFPGDVIEFGMAQNGTAPLPFKASSTLRISLIQEYA